MNFVYLDIDDPNNNTFKKQLDYRYQPHLILLDPDGNVIQQFVGYTDEAVLEEAILNALGQ